MKKILCIGAHPDDIEIGCGGVIKKYTELGAEVYFLIGTLGGEVILNGNNWDTIEQQRKDESFKSAKLLGAIDVIYLELKDTFIRHDGETVRKVENYINQICPDTIFTHTKDDNHQDHKNLALSVISASRRQKVNILHYESPSTAQTFFPKVYADITETIDDKIKAIHVFETQMEKVYVNPEVIRGLAQYRGFNSNYRLAEAFDISKYFI
ncbi:MAG: PIG-L family deacetylase [Candidatus Atribacteria bacterium]|nr:PIG-L family deacetylase [Candidatus Atribacteria bacterium]